MATGGGVLLNAHDESIQAHGIGHEGTEQSHSGIEIPAGLPGLGLGSLHHGRHQGSRGAAMDLPETTAIHPEFVCDTVVRDGLTHGALGWFAGVGTRNQTVVNLHDLMGVILTQAASAIGQLDISHPGPPTQARLVTGDRNDRHPEIDTGKSLQLLLDHLLFEGALGLKLHVLEVAAAAASGPGVLAGRDDPLWRCPQDGDRVGESVPLARPCDLGLDQLPRQRMTHEEDLTFVPGHEVPAVGDLADFDVDLLTDTKP